MLAFIHSGLYALSINVASVGKIEPYPETFRNRTTVSPPKVNQMIVATTMIRFWSDILQLESNVTQP